MNDRVRCATALLPLALLVTAVQAVGAKEETAAVLKLREVDFFYRSSATELSCSHVQGRVASVLRALGAREDVKVTVNGCDAVVSPILDDPTEDRWQTQSERWEGSPDPWDRSSDRWGSSGSADPFRNRARRREQSAHVRIRAMMPVEATPEVLAEMEKDKSRRELVRRVTGSHDAMSEPIVFPAERREVDLSRRTLKLEPEECELLEQMSKSIFKELGIRVVRRSTGCSRDQVSHIPPSLTVEALMPVLPSVPTLSPAAGEEEEGDSG